MENEIEIDATSKGGPSFRPVYGRIGVDLRPFCDCVRKASVRLCHSRFVVCSRPTLFRSQRCFPRDIGSRSGVSQAMASELPAQCYDDAVELIPNEVRERTLRAEAKRSRRARVVIYDSVPHFSGSKRAVRILFDFCDVIKRKIKVPDVGTVLKQRTCLSSLWSREVEPQQVENVGALLARAAGEAGFCIDYRFSCSVHVAQGVVG